MQLNQTRLAILILPALILLSSERLCAQSLGSVSSDQMRLIEQLSDADWDVREGATLELMSVDPSLLPELAQLAARSASVDTRLRLRRICLEMFRTQRLGPARAFLGIRNTPAVWGATSGLPSVDEGLPVGHQGLLVDHVINGTAAEKAGLLPRDLVIAIDGERAMIDQQQNYLTSLIGAKRPGALCVFSVIRGARERLFAMNPESGNVPTDFAGAVVDIVTNDQNPLLAPHTCGLKVVDVKQIAPVYGVETGDIITTVDMIPFEPATAMAQWQQWLDGTLNTEAAVAEWNSAVPPRPPIGHFRAKIPTLGVLRGGELLEIEARLGRWPRHLERDNPNPFQPQRAKREDDTERAFKAWWRERVNADSEVSDDALRASLYWRMELEGN